MLPNPKDLALNKNNQIERINNLLIELASGNFRYKEDISEKNDEFDAIITGINMLGEELEASTVSRDYLNSIYKGVVDMLIVLKPDNTIQRINAAVSPLMGYEESELMGEHISLLFDEEDSEQFVKTNEELFKKGICYNIERMCKTKDGRLIPVSCSCSLLFDKKQRLNGILYIAKDISKIKQAEVELTNINKELNTFVYKASHDLKGPLASIIGLVGIAEEDIENATQKDAAEIALNYFKMVKESARILENNLINLIEVTYLKQAGLNSEVIDLPEVIGNIIQSLRHVKGYEKVQVELDLHQEFEFVSDLKLLKSILQNLIENAFKYRNEDLNENRVKITFHQSKTESTLEIADNGLGVPEEFQEKIFEMFFRASQRSSGSGLGLYLVRNSVQKLGGTIALNSDAEGSSFLVELPHLPIRKDPA